MDTVGVHRRFSSRHAGRKVILGKGNKFRSLFFGMWVFTGDLHKGSGRSSSLLTG